MPKKKKATEEPVEEDQFYEEEETSNAESPSSFLTETLSQKYTSLEALSENVTPETLALAAKDIVLPFQEAINDFIASVQENLGAADIVLFEE